MLDAIHWDADLIRRHDRPGPRYTSYPTAVQFHGEVGSFDLLHALRDSRKAKRPLSLYVHVPFCASPCFYCGCTKIITRDATAGARYLTHLAREVDRHPARFAGGPVLRGEDEVAVVDRRAELAGRHEIGADGRRDVSHGEDDL